MPARRLVAAVLLAGLALTGCFTGERPQLAEPPMGGEVGSATGDTNVDAVLRRLEGAGQATVTADYTILRTLGQQQTTAVVVQDPNRRSVTIGEIRFLFLGSDETCNLATGFCESGINDARVSDTGVTNEFFAAAPARRLRISNARKTGDTTTHAETIAGDPSVCVDVPVGGGTETYCAGERGLITRWRAADVEVELTSIEPTADEQYFATAG